MKNSKRIEELVEKLNLHPHPEGGFYKETYRSEILVNGNSRNILTSIYFLLTGTNCSKFHRIQSDEAWYFHEGNSLQVHELSDEGHKITHLGINLTNGQVPFHIVKAKTIFGSSIAEKDGYALVSCAVAPGFDFNDFELFDTQTLLNWFPNNEQIIRQLS